MTSACQWHQISLGSAHFDAKAGSVLTGLKINVAWNRGWNIAMANLGGKSDLAKSRMELWMGSRIPAGGWGPTKFEARLQTIIFVMRGL